MGKQASVSQGGKIVKRRLSHLIVVAQPLSLCLGKYHMDDPKNGIEAHLLCKVHNVEESISLLRNTLCTKDLAPGAADVAH